MNPNIALSQPPQKWSWYARQAFRRLRVPGAQFQALSRPDSAPRCLECLLGGSLLSTSLGPEFGPLRELLQDFQVEGAEDLRLAPPRGHGRGRDHGEDDEGDGHVRPVDLYKRSL
jgi:hypothetical protein